MFPDIGIRNSCRRELHAHDPSFDRQLYDQKETASIIKEIMVSNVMEPS